MVRHQLDLARRSVAAFLDTDAANLVFTASATEAIVTAIHGAAVAEPGATIVVTAAEHRAVRDAARRAGRVAEVGIGPSGVVDPDEVAATIDGERRAGRAVSLVACQLANHEVGAVQPVSEVIAHCRQRNVDVLVDAAQGAGRRRLSLDGLGAAAVVVSGHKLGGPPGIGVMAMPDGRRLDPLIGGGDQEDGRRAGHQNVVAAVGLGAACAELTDTLDGEIDRMSAVARVLRAGLASVPGVRLVGPADERNRVDHIVPFVVDEHDPNAVVAALDARGIAAAVVGGVADPSPLVAEMAGSHGAIRLSASWATDPDDIPEAVDAVAAALSELRAVAPQNP